MILPTHTTLSSGFMSSIFLRLLCGLWLRLTCSPFSRAEVVLKGGYGFRMDSYIFKKWLHCWNRHKSKLELQSWRIGQAKCFLLDVQPKHTSKKIPDSNHVQRHMFTTWLPLHSCLAGDYLVMSAWPFQSCCCGERCGTNGANGEPVAVPSVRANDGPQETRNEDEWSRPWRRAIQFSTCELWINSNTESSSKICQRTALYSFGETVLRPIWGHTTCHCHSSSQIKERKLQQVSKVWGREKRQYDEVMDCVQRFKVAT